MPRSNFKVRHGHRGAKSHTIKHDGKRGPGRVPTRHTSERYRGKERNPFTVETRTIRDPEGSYNVHNVLLGPVRMKLPRLRRCSR